MAKSKTVIELLAQQPDEELQKMREANRLELQRAEKEVSRLKVEAHQIEQAIKRRSGAKSGGRLTRDEVFSVATQLQPPFSPTEVQEVFALFDREATVNTIRNHLNRLVESEKLGRDKETGGYFVRREFVPKVTVDTSASDDDIPF